MYKLAIFDMDGTILDTLTDLHLSINHILEIYGHTPLKREETKCYIGNGIPLFVQRAFEGKFDVNENEASSTVKAAISDFMEYYSVHCEDNTKAYDGITEAIAQIRKLGIMTAVVSNKADPAVKKLCESYFDGLFDEMIGEQPGIRKKPAPDMPEMIMERCGVSKEETVFIGDSNVDINTALNAGTAVIGVLWGYRDEEALKKAGAKVIATQPKELAGLM